MKKRISKIIFGGERLMSKLVDIVKFSDDLLEKIHSEIYKKAEEIYKH